MAVGRRQRDDLRCDVFRESMLEARRVDVQDLGNTGDLAGRIGRALRVVSGNENVHLAVGLRCSRDGVERGGLDAGVVVFSDDESGHVRSPWLRS